LARHIPWLRILAEGVAIVVSILLAFGVQAWWEQRQVRDEEQQALIGLEADFLANLLELNRTVSTHTDFMRAVARLEEMSDEDRAALTKDSAAVFVRAMTTPATFAVRDGTLDAMLASGKLDIISDPVLRDLLVEWKASLDDVSEEVTRLYDATIQLRQRILELGPPWPFMERLRDAAQFRTASVDYGPTELVILARDKRVLELALGRAWMAGTYLNEVRGMVPLAEGVLDRLNTQIRGAPPVSFVVQGATDAMIRGLQAHFQALVSFSNGTTRSVGFHSVWSSSDSSVMALGSYGLGSPGETGQAEVCATYRDMSDCIVVTVAEP